MVWTASSVSDITLVGEFVSVDRFDAWPSDIRWDGNRRYPLSTGCDRFEPKFSLPATTNGYRSAVRAPRDSYRKFSTTSETTLAGQQERLLGLRGERKPLLRFQVSKRRDRGRAARDGERDERR